MYDAAISFVWIIASGALRSGRSGLRRAERVARGPREPCGGDRVVVLLCAVVNKSFAWPRSQPPRRTFRDQALRPRITSLNSHVLAISRARAAFFLYP